MIFGAEYLIYLTIVLMFILSFRFTFKEKKAMLLAFLAIPIAVLLIKGIHFFFFENRPFVYYDITPLIAHNPNASFPSRHASIMSVITFAYFIYRSKWAPFFLVFLIWVGLARVYVGVHYPLDIVGGIILGIVSLIIGKLFIKMLKVKLS